MSSYPYPLDELFELKIKSDRKKVTFEKVWSNRSLNADQIDKLKTAQALYECVPLITYSPFFLYFLRSIGRVSTGRGMLLFLGQVAVVAPPVEYLAVTQRDKLYWPIVREVYLELKEQERSRSKSPFEMIKQSLKPEAEKELQELQRLRAEREGWVRKLKRVYDRVN